MAMDESEFDQRVDDPADRRSTDMKGPGDLHPGYGTVLSNMIEDDRTIDLALECLIRRVGNFESHS